MRIASGGELGEEVRPEGGRGGFGGVARHEAG